MHLVTGNSALCLSPQEFDGQAVSCRRCWQCKHDRRRQLAGVCAAEKSVSPHTTVLTLTYGGGDHAKAAVLHYSDVQDWLKRLRHITSCRHLTVGEYGAHKRRAHFHTVLFHDQPLDLKIGERQDWGLWGHGHVYADRASLSSILYVTKYLLKGDFRDTVRGQSTRPPLGKAFFSEMIAKQVRDGLPPRSFRYRVPGVTKKGKSIEFGMSPSLRERYMSEFLSAWKAAKGEFPSHSEFCRDWMDKRDIDY